REDHVAVQRRVIGRRIALIPGLRPQLGGAAPNRRRNRKKTGLAGKVVQPIESATSSRPDQLSAHFVIGPLGHHDLYAGSNQFGQPRLATSRLVRALGIGRKAQWAGIEQNDQAHGNCAREDATRRLHRASRRTVSVSRCSCSSPSDSHELSNSISSLLRWANSSSVRGEAYEPEATSGLTSRCRTGVTAVYLLRTHRPGWEWLTLRNRNLTTSCLNASVRKSASRLQGVRLCFWFRKQLIRTKNKV